MVPRQAVGDRSRRYLGGSRVVDGLYVAVVPSAVLILMSRNVVLGGAVGFVLLNALTILTRQPGSLIALCLLLSAIIVATHLAGSWSRYVEAIRTRQWGVMLWVE